jgi:hypothetical protein
MALNVVPYTTQKNAGTVVETMPAVINEFLK